MNLKTAYHKYHRYVDCGGERLTRKVTSVAEVKSVIKRHDMYDKINWDTTQQMEFDDFWKTNYGKKISNKWHRIYESINGQYCVDYFPEMLYTTKLEPLLNDYRYAEVLADKAFVDTFAGVVHCNAPETIVLRSKGIFYDYKRRVITIDKARTLLRNYKKDIVIKPTTDSGSGKAIRIVRADDLKTVVRDLEHFGKDYVMQAVINQHDIFKSLNPTSVNTLRVMTYILNDNIYHIPLACRMGSNSSNVDNIHAGGLGVGVNDNGSMHSTAYQLGYGNSDKSFVKHPVTGVTFADIMLPSIKEVIEKAYELHGRLPHLGVISWDFTVDNNCEPVLIELNLWNQGIWFPQIVHGKGAFGDNTIGVLSLLKEKRNS